MAELSLFLNYSFSSSTLSFKNNRRFSKKCAKKKVSLFYKINGTENEAKIKHRSRRHNINRIKPRHGSKYTKYKMCLSIMIVIYIKQHLSTEAQFMKRLSNTEVDFKKRCL